MTAAQEIRKAWRWHWQRLWLCQWEASVLTSSWREQNIQEAHKAMRAKVREYAKARGWRIAA